MTLKIVLLLASLLVVHDDAVASEMDTGLHPVHTLTGGDPCAIFPDVPYDSYHIYYPYLSDEDCLAEHTNIPCTGCCEFQVEGNTYDVWQFFSAADERVCHVTAKGGECYCRNLNEIECLVISSMEADGTCSNTDLPRGFDGFKNMVQVSSCRIRGMLMVWLLVVFVTANVV